MTDPTKPDPPRCVRCDGPLYLIRPGRDICAACEPRQVLPRKNNPKD